MKKSLISVWIVLIAVKMACVVQAQPKRSAEAEQVFQVALDAFKSGNYLAAYAGFRDVYEKVPVHTKTTVAHLMAGKSLYRLSDYVLTVDLLEEFIVEYPSSNFVEEATRLIAAAKRSLQNIEISENAIQVGLALPLSSVEFATTRSMFLGLQLAVNAYNKQYEQKVRLVFRDTKKTSAGARSAVSSLIDSGVSVIIGPLFSDQVDAVADMTELSQIVLIAPLATDTDLTEGHRHIFQVNATLEDRGRSIARHAMGYLNLARIGIVTEAGNEVSEEMAQGFISELAENGMNLKFIYEVESSVDWSRLPSLIGRDTLSVVDGIYFSVYHHDERHRSRLIQDGVNSIIQTGLRPTILGPSTWKYLNLDILGASMKAFYVDIYYENDNRLDVQRFVQSYKESYEDSTPDLFAYIGYDVMGVLLENLDKGGVLIDHLLDAPTYEGVRMRVQFGEDRRNSALYLFEHTPDGPQLIR